MGKPRAIPLTPPSCRGPHTHHAGSEILISQWPGAEIDNSNQEEALLRWGPGWSAGQRPPAALAGGGLSAQQPLVPCVQHPFPLNDLSSSLYNITGVIGGLWRRLIRTTLQLKLPNWNDYVSCNLTPILWAGATPGVIHRPFASQQVTHLDVAKAFLPE